MEDEIEILKSIFNDDIISVNLDNNNPSLEIVLYPANSEETYNKKFIRLNLIVFLSKNYPDEVPKFQFKNVRGISDDYILEINRIINEKCEKNLGMPMLYDIFQEIKDILTNHGDIPNSCVCTICLHNFDNSQNFIRLECYHYFHTPCLLKHIEYMQMEIDKEKEEAKFYKIVWKPRYICCPICRENLKEEEINDLNEAKKNIEINKSFHNNNPTVIISKKTRDLQNKMKLLFEKQKLKGGIIDINEKNQDIIILNRPSTQQNQNENNNTEPTNLLQA